MQIKKMGHLLDFTHVKYPFQTNKKTNKKRMAGLALVFKG